MLIFIIYIENPFNNNILFKNALYLFNMQKLNKKVIKPYNRL